MLKQYFGRRRVIIKTLGMNRIKHLLALTLTLAMLPMSAQVTNGAYRALADANSARIAALGGMPLPVHDGDIQNVTFNPSAISKDMHNQLAVSYVGDFNLGTNFATAQYSRTFEKMGSFAASVQYYNYGNMTYATDGGHADGSTFNVSDYAVTIGWGRELTDKWSIGANLKYAGLQYESAKAGAIGVDVAATYWAYSNWAFSLTARNIGRQIFCQEMYIDNKWLPFSLDFMASKKLDHLPLTLFFAYNDIQKWNKRFDDPLDLAGNYDPITGQITEPSKMAKFFTNLACHLVIGGELEIGKNLLLRASYNHGTHYYMDVPSARTLVGFSAGFGVRIKAFQIDYALSRSSIVGSPHFLTLRMDLSKF